MNAPSQDRAPAASRVGYGTAVLAALGTMVVAAGAGLGLEKATRPECELPVEPRPTPPGPRPTGPGPTNPRPTDDGADTPAQPCAGVAGQWHFTTVTTWANANYDYFGDLGHYQLDVDAHDGCNVTATLSSASKDYKRASTRVTVTPTSDGGLRLVAGFVLPKAATGAQVDGQRLYQLTFRDDAIEGGWRFFNTKGDLLTFGALRGGHQPLDAAPSSDLATYGCVAQCWALCSSPNAIDRCVSRNCEPTPTVVSDCGAPASDFVVPSRAGRNSSLGIIAIQSNRLEPGHCAEAAAHLVGRWSVWQVGAAAPWTLTLEASGCELSGRGDGGVQYMGTVDAPGAWVVGPVYGTPGGPVPSEEWSFMGWGPAFGVGSSGTHLAAYRR
jgi:hypothetical protein